MNIAESSGPGLVVGLILAAVGLIYWWQTRRAWGFGAILVGIAVGIAAVIVDLRLETERERVERNLLAMCDAFQREDQAFFGYLSPSAPELAGLATTAIALVDINDDLRISDISTEMLSENSRASVHFRANASVKVIGMGEMGYQPTRWRILFQKEGDEWKVIRITRLNPVNGDEMTPLERRSG